MEFNNHSSQFISVKAVYLHARLMIIFNDEFVVNHHKIVKRSPRGKVGRNSDRRERKRERCRKQCKQSKLLCIIVQSLFNWYSIIVQLVFNHCSIGIQSMLN